MAEQKACEGVVAAAHRADESRSLDGDTSSASSVHGESLLLPYLVEHLRSSLQQQQQQQQQQLQLLQQQQHQRTHHHQAPPGHVIEDSGTESGEDLRFLAAGLRDSIELHRQESSAQLSAPSQPHGPGPGPGHGQDGLLDDVQSALSRLEASLLQGVVGNERVEEGRREALLQLVSRLKNSLGSQAPAPAPPQPVAQQDQHQQAPVAPPRRFGSKKRQNRHTVGVSQEELADARRFLEEAKARQQQQQQQQQQKQQQATPTEASPSPSRTTAADVLPAPLVVSIPLPLTRARSPYQLQKQSSAGDVPAATSTFRAYRPAHFMPRKFSHSATSTPPSTSVPASTSASGSSLTHSESVHVHSKSSSQSSVGRRQAPVSIKSSFSSVGSHSNEDDDEDEEEDDEEDEDDEEEAFVEVVTEKGQSGRKVLDDNANLLHESDITHKDYDPSKKLFTPEQSVQIAVHKAAINKQLSVEENKAKRVSETSEEEEESEVTESVDEETEEEENYYDVEDEEEDHVGMVKKGNAIQAQDQQQGVVRNQTFTVKPTESIINKIHRTNFESKTVSSNDTIVKSSPKQDFHAPTTQTVMVQNPVYVEEKPNLGRPLNHQSSATRFEHDFADTQSNASDTSDTLQGDDSAVSSAQRLLKMATSDQGTFKAGGSRFANRNNKKQKMKRANTIDIPKPLNYYEVDEDTEEGDVTSGDEAFLSAHDSNNSVSEKRAAYLALRGPIRVTGETQQPPQHMQPKTENDRKFLAFLEQQSVNGKKGGSLWSGVDEHNGIASPVSHHAGQAGHQWNNRFANIKTAFENSASHQTREQQLNKLNSDRNNMGRQSGGARSFWQTADDSMVKGKGRGGRANGAASHEPRLSKQSSAFLKQLHEQGQAQGTRLPWTASDQPDDQGVVVGSLTVHANNRQEQQRQKQQQPQQRQKHQRQQEPEPQGPQGPVNKFFHAPMSAFKPIEKTKPTPSAPWATPPAATGSVKQLAAKKFEQPAPPPPEKPTVMHAPKAVHPAPTQTMSLPVPAEQSPSPLSPTLPWKKDLGHTHHLTSTLAKFESMSSRETSPQMLPVMRSQSQDRVMMGVGMRHYPQPPQPPPRAFIPAPSTGNVQSRTQSFSVKQPVPAPAPPPVLPPHSAFAHEFSTRPGYGHGLVHSKSNQYVPSSDLHWHPYESDLDLEETPPPPTDNKLVLSTLQAREDVGGYVSPSVNAPPIPTFSAGVTVRQSVFGVPPSAQSPVAHSRPQATATPDSYSSTPPPYEQTPPPSRPPRLVIQDAVSPSPGSVQYTPEPEEHTAAVARVMGGAQCQKAITVTNKMRHRYDDDGGSSGGGVSSAAMNLTSVLNKFSSEEETSPKPTAPQQQPLPQQQPSPSKSGTASHATPRYRSEPNASAVSEAARMNHSNGGSPMTSVRPSPVGTPYGTPFSNQSQSPVAVNHGSDWSGSPHQGSPRVQPAPVGAKPVDMNQEARMQAAKKYAESRTSSSTTRAPASTSSTPSRSRASSIDSLITSTSTEELHDTGESVVTTRLQIPVNKVSDTIQRYQAQTQGYSQDAVERSERSPSVSPNPGNVLRKSESWHQLAAQQQGLVRGRPQSMHGGNGQDLPPAAPVRSPALPKAKSSHSLAFPKQFEAAIKPDSLQVKQKTVEQYFKRSDGAGDSQTSVKVKHHHNHHHHHQQQQQQYSKKSVQSSLTVSTKKLSHSSSSNYEPLTPVEVLLVDDNLENVDEAFESLFAASVGSDGLPRTLSRQTSANYKQRRLSNSKPKLGGYSASVTRTSGAQSTGSAIKSSK